MADRRTRDAGKWVGMGAILCAVVAVPAWLGASHQAKLDGPAVPLGSACIAPAAEMRKRHPALLSEWRERAVREGDRVHVTPDGRRFRISLGGTCLGCHGSATELCDRCHAQAGVTLSCWQCHADRN